MHEILGIHCDGPDVLFKDVFRRSDGNCIVSIRPHSKMYPTFCCIPKVFDYSVTASRE